MPQYRVFVSSPGDVGEERLLAQTVLERLRVEYARQITVEPVFWEHEPLRATASFQEQISRPSEADAVVTILWARVGTRLPSHLTRPDGSTYQSGTEFEFEDAAASFRQKGLPDLLVYRKTAPPVAVLDDAVVHRLAEKRALDAFLDRWFLGTDGSFTAAFHPFERPAQFEELLERHLRKLIETRLSAAPRARTSSPAPAWQHGSPFRGLQSFDVDHALVFAGRTQAVSDVLQALRQQAALGHAFVLMTGGSGLGKSSLARAGVLPTLTRPGVIEGVGVWRRAVMRPSSGGADLCLELARTLAAPDALPGLSANASELTQLAELLKSGTAAVGPMLRAQLQLEAEDVQRVEHLEHRPAAKLVLLVDQLEEIFTLPQVTAADREAFVGAVATLVKSGVVWAIATLRSDFYPRCSEIPALIALKDGAGQYDVRPPTAAEIGQIIRIPARLAGLDFEERPDAGERLDDVLRDAAAAEPDALPLLEFALEELYRRREGTLLTFDAYTALGGLQGAVAQRAEEVFTALPHDAQQGLGACFGALVTVDLTNQDLIVSRPAALDTLRQAPGGPDLVDRFVESRLLVADRAESGPATVRVAHDALLRLWPRLRDWMASNIATLRLRALIAASAVIWRTQGGSASFLLPAGEALSYATRLRRESPQELTPHEAEYIERSHSTARRLVRRRRVIRALQIAAVLLLLILAAAYWEAYHHERVEFYAGSVLRWGLPEGIGALSADAARTRTGVTRLRRTGRLGSIEIANVDEQGDCTSPDWGPTSAYEIDAEALEEMFSENSPSPDEQKPEACRWVFSRHWTGAVDTVRAFAAMGQSLYSIKYEPYRLDRAAFVNDKGYVSARFKSGAGVVEFGYHSAAPHAGLIEAVRFFDAYGSPQSDANGTCGWRIIYDDRGFVARVLSLNCKWEPMVLKAGMSGVQVTFDGDGFMSTLRLIGVDGQLVTTPDLGAQWHISRDTHGRMAEVRVLDANGDLLLVPKMGMARMTTRYDDRGRTLETAYFDASNNLSTSPVVGCARMLLAYESHGELSSLECRGPKGELLPTPVLNSFARVEVVNDEKGRPQERSFFDEFDRLVLWRFDDEHGNLRLDAARGFAQRTVTFGVERGAGGQPHLRLTLRHDDQEEHELFTLTILLDAGEHEVWARYTRDDKPIAMDGYHRRESSYDAAGRLVETRYLDVENKPCLSDGGFSRVRFVYDEQGRVRKRLHFDQAGHELATAVVITAVDEGGPAAKAGVKAGDAVLRYGDEAIESLEALIELVRRNGTGMRRLVLERGGQQVSLDVPAGRLGVTLAQKAR